MPQVARFSNGGFVVHKILGKFKGHVSAWFDANGRLLDCEQILRGTSRNIKRDGPMWRELTSIGRIYRSN